MVKLMAKFHKKLCYLFIIKTFHSTLPSVEELTLNDFEAETK